MHIQVNTDHTIEGREALSAYICAAVDSALSHLSQHVTRVEVHVADENGPKGGLKNIRCAMEARLEHHQPVAVTEEAATLHQAVEGAAGKLARLLEHTVGRLRDERTHRTDPLPPGAKLAEQL